MNNWTTLTNGVTIHVGDKVRDRYNGREGIVTSVNGPFSGICMPIEVDYGGVRKYAHPHFIDLEVIEPMANKFMNLFL